MCMLDWHFALQQSSNMSSQLANLVPIMNGLNYLPWKEQMTTFLKAQGVWTIITGDEIIPVMPSQTTAALALEVQKEQHN